MPSVFRVFFQPVFDGQTDDEIPKAEDADPQLVGVSADSLEEAIDLVKNKFIGEELEDTSDKEERWKGNKTIERIIFLSVEHVSTIDIG
jgi:hypothetical protein